MNTANKHKAICIAGMPGSGKSTVSDYFVKQGFQFIRFGQVVLDEVKKLGKKRGEKIERKVRENLRKKHGKEAIAKLIIPKIDKMLTKGNVVADGLYSFSEYKIFRKHFRQKFVLIAIFAPPKLRYERISKRKSVNDLLLRNRSFTKKEAKMRDFAEIENLEKGGPIAMSHYTLINTKDLDFLYNQINEILSQIIE